MTKVDLYEVCIYYIIYGLLFYFMTILKTFTTPARFVVSLSPGERSSRSIGQNDSIWKRIRINMNSGGQRC